MKPSTKQSDPMQGSTLFTFMGIPWKLSPTSLSFLPSRLVFGLAIAFIFLWQTPLRVKILFGLVYALILLSSQFLHIVGHILGGKAVGYPLSASLIVAYQFTTYYGDEPPDLPRQVHLIRTIGGPLMNFVIAIGAFIAWQIYAGHILLFATIINLLLASLLFLPIKGFDGEIFWREIRRI